MGWTSYRASYYKNGRVDRLAECREEFGNNPEWATIVKDALVGAKYYAAMKSTKTGKIWALIVLTEIRKGEFFYKDMDETVHPFYYDCPKSILKLLSSTDNGMANEWRKNCLQAHKTKREAKQEKKKSFEDGEGEQGVCPCCGGKQLHYGAMRKDNVGIFYPWTCENCKSKGEETYELTFTGHYNKN